MIIFYKCLTKNDAAVVFIKAENSCGFDLGPIIQLARQFNRAVVVLQHKTAISSIAEQQIEFQISREFVFIERLNKFAPGYHVMPAGNRNRRPLDAFCREPVTVPGG